MTRHGMTDGLGDWYLYTPKRSLSEAYTCNNNVEWWCQLLFIYKGLKGAFVDKWRTAVFKSNLMGMAQTNLFFIYSLETKGNIWI